MIRNTGTLLKGIPADLRKRRAAVLNVADFVLEKLCPAALLHSAKGAFSKAHLRPFKRISIIGIGKAGRSLTQAVTALLGRRPDSVLIADKGHPTPTREGVRSTQKIIKEARSLDEKDLAIVLISGGGSSMLTAPVPEITLEDKIETTKKLLRSGATINEINVVRKHLSQVKGGRLAALLYPATVIGLVISDVVGNDLGTIASGPLTPDSSTFKNALHIVKKYHLKLPKRVSAYLEKGARTPTLETPKPGERYFQKVTQRIIADRSSVAELAAQKARKLGLKPLIIKKPITGEARAAVRQFIRKARTGTLLIGTGETTVTCTGKGKGGRNQEFVLGGLKFLKDTQTLLALGTDGVDGICPEAIAGALADRAVQKSAYKKNLNARKILKNNDSYRFFKAAGGHIKTGPTGTNVGDLALLLA